MDNETKNKRPWQLLPMPKPADFDPGPEFFYKNFVQPMIADSIKMMCAGMHIDEDAVESLRSTIDDVLSNVDALLLRNPIIQRYQEQRAIVAQKNHYNKSTEAVRTPDVFYRDYDKSVVHRTWVVNTYLKSIGSCGDVKESWTVKDLKRYNIFKADKTIDKIIDKSIAKNSKVLKNGMQALAEYKAELWNRPRYARVDKANPDMVKFDSSDPEHIKLYKQMEQQLYGKAKPR